jgi:hypothetical protein
MRMAKRLCHLITTKCEIDNAEGGPLPPDVSFDDDVIGDENLGEDEDDEVAAQNQVIFAPKPPADVPQVARGKGVLAPLPQNISRIAASQKRAALKNKSDDILELYKLKILQKNEERERERLNVNAMLNGVLAPLPQYISGIAAYRKRAGLKNKSDDILDT